MKHGVETSWTSKVPKMMAQYPAIKDHRQYRVHFLGAILPVLSVLGYWAIVLDTLEVQVFCISFCHAKDIGATLMLAGLGSCIVHCRVFCARTSANPNTLPHTPGLKCIRGLCNHSGLRQ